jgi:steroid delta-isomerase-like uncharacterized protein
MAQENSALIRRWFEEVWNKGRMEAIDEMASPDIVGHGQAQHDTDIGLDEFKPFVVNLRNAFPDMNVVIDHTIEQGDKVAARWTSTMTHKGPFLGFAPTGKKVVITGTSIQRIANGKIVEGWDNWDQLGLLVQIGAVPAAHFVVPVVATSERRSA